MAFAPRNSARRRSTARKVPRESSSAIKPTVQHAYSEVEQDLAVAFPSLAASSFNLAGKSASADLKNSTLEDGEESDAASAGSLSFADLPSSRQHNLSKGEAPASTFPDMKREKEDLLQMPGEQKGLADDALQQSICELAERLLRATSAGTADLPAFLQIMRPLHPSDQHKDPSDVLCLGLGAVLHLQQLRDSRRRRLVWQSLVILAAVCAVASMIPMLVAFGMPPHSLPPS